MANTKFKKMTDYTDEELDDAISDSVGHLSKLGLDFYSVLRGVDAYMQKRMRKDHALAYGGRQATRDQLEALSSSIQHSLKKMEDLQKAIHMPPNPVMQVGQQAQATAGMRNAGVAANRDLDKQMQHEQAKEKWDQRLKDSRG